MSRHRRLPYLATFAALLALTGLTVFVAGKDLGWLNTPFALGVAVLKATLVALFFMHLYGGRALSRVFAIAAVVWLGILVTMTLGDYVQRESVTGWAPARAPKAVRHPRVASPSRRAARRSRRRPHCHNRGSEIRARTGR